VVEIVAAARTAPEVVESLAALSGQIGCRAIVTSDSPGFVVNHAGRAFVTEGLKLLAEHTADHQTLDAILRICGGFRMGPFELLDLTGLDVSVPVMESIHAQYYGDDRYRPSTLARTRMLAGLLGRKNGQGFYSYGSARSKVAATAGTPEPAGDLTWWCPAAGPGTLPASIIALLPSGSRVASDSADVLMLAPLASDLSQTVAELQLDSARAVAVDPMFGGPAGITLMASPGTGDGAVMTARRLFAARSIPTFVIGDSPGYVAPRVVACIINLACEMAQQGVAAPEDIDAAVKLGLGYPVGPFEWGDRIGAGRIWEILRGLQTAFGDQRYRPSPWLVRRSRMSMPLAAPDRK